MLLSENEKGRQSSDLCKNVPSRAKRGAFFARKPRSLKQIQAVPSPINLACPLLPPAVTAVLGYTSRVCMVTMRKARAGPSVRHLCALLYFRLGTSLLEDIPVTFPTPPERIDALPSVLLERTQNGFECRREMTYRVPTEVGHIFIKGCNEKFRRNGVNG